MTCERIEETFQGGTSVWHLGLQMCTYIKAYQFKRRVVYCAKFTSTKQCLVFAFQTPEESKHNYRAAGDKPRDLELATASNIDDNHGYRGME